MKNKGKTMKTNNTPLQKFRILRGKELILFFMDRFDFTADEAIRMEMKMVGGYKVQVI